MQFESLKNNPFINNENNNMFGNFSTQKFLIGVAIGAIGAYLLTNENAQKKLLKAVAKGSELFQTGIEEMKERFEDAKAEIEANKE